MHKRKYNSERLEFLYVILCCFLCANSPLIAQDPNTAGSNITRHRICINDGWRFFKYDSKEKADSLIYDLRPDVPVAHILPHWNWPDRIGRVTPVLVFTSGDEAELFLNGISQGRKKKEQYEYRLRWDSVKYQPGELKVIAYKNHKKWAEDIVKTTGQPVKLLASTDRNTIKANGKDLAFITISVADKYDLVVPCSNNKLEFAIDGPGEILGTDNGNPVNMESFVSDKREAFGGLCQVIIRSIEGKPGSITLTVKSRETEGVRIRIASLYDADAKRIIEGYQKGRHEE